MAAYHKVYDIVLLVVI